MCIMESKSQEKGKIEDIRSEQQGTDSSQQRPKSFSLKRRQNLYYFSDDSSRGILKRVPMKGGSYRLNQLQTVFEKPVASKIQNEIWSDVQLNSSETSKADKNVAVSESVDSYELAYHKEAALKPLDEIGGIESPSHVLKNLEILKAYEDRAKLKSDGKEQLKVLDEGQKEERIYKSFKAKRKKYKLDVSILTEFEKLKICAAGKENEKLSASDTICCSSKKADGLKDNDQRLNVTWTEGSLNHTLDISMKTPLT